MRTVEALQIEHERRNESEASRLTRLVALACQWLDDGDSVSEVFIPDEKHVELDKHLRARTGACARQLLRTLGGLE